MGQVTICDICKQVINSSANKYILGINPVTQKQGYKINAERFEETADVLVNTTYRYGKVQLFEICSDCKKVLEYLFKMRKEELKKLKETIEKMYKEGENSE